MRRALALLLLASLLAGCTSGTSDDDPAPPNADPNGAQTLPPAGSTSPSTGPPTASNSTTASSTSSATTTSTYAAPGPTSFGGHDEEDSSTAESFPALFVSGRLHGSGPSLRIEAAANNMGERAYRIPDGTCQKPWSESMAGPSGQAVQHRQPAATCAAFGLKELAARDFVATALTWDGTVWDATAGRFVAAPSGSYVWTVAFDVYSGGSGAQFDDHARMTLSFDVTVP